MQIKVRTDFDVTIGIAAFPQDGLIYSDLVTAALANPVDFRESLWLDELENAKPFVLDNATNAENDEQKVLPDHSGRLLHLSAVLGNRRLDLRKRQNSKAASPFKLSVHDLRNPDLWINNVPYQSASSRLVYRIIKRLLDIGLVLIALPLALPLMIVIALIIRFSDGGRIFFRQQRTGLGGRRFYMYKFRTMIPNAEEKLKELAAEGLAVLDKNGKLAEPLKLEVDPRVTRIGRFLRKTSLDELPQMWNVLRGDMSIVGPRPTSWDLDSYNLLQTERLSVRPGITGLWQVCDRGSTEFDAWVQWDMVYIDKMNLLLDIQIIIRTFTKVLKRTGAF
jgi:lipopolysaccharide/colanic/teichoic acid biosynthesis glycosyltransferase